MEECMVDRHSTLVWCDVARTTVLFSQATATVISPARQSKLHTFCPQLPLSTANNCVTTHICCSTICARRRLLRTTPAERMHNVATPESAASHGHQIAAHTSVYRQPISDRAEQRFACELCCSVSSMTCITAHAVVRNRVN